MEQLCLFSQKFTKEVLNEIECWTNGKGNWGTKIKEKLDNLANVKFISDEIKFH